MGSEGDDSDRPDHPDRRGYGEGWDELRQATLRRDGYACTRCGADDRTLQAHHVIPRGAGGPDALENLLTLCRPCHGVIHQSNSSFDDVRDEAPLFPKPDAPDPVARLREPIDQCCSRCGVERTDSGDLVAWIDPPSGPDEPDSGHFTLCKSCAGFLAESDARCEYEDLTGMGRLQIHELSTRRLDARVRPSLFAPPQVAVRREPRTLRERVLFDTPLRFVFTGPVRWLVAGTTLYVLATLLFTSL
ncbi:HNH endonuclease [Natrarchaeobaculum aegyptiacum]|uniref:HNH endonuclease n=1 Tax=Natrarchaeobaculum aegyptiacum TaxID=745377 RepID=A0A2Z2HVT6_9EURY|nr:HNH endonuclease [Natrarchaeobaculum aegyptiacum]ARS91320.1 HNH endonuclease [Natrarchaeobaculum aegyptiacum]